MKIVKYIVIVSLFSISACSDDDEKKKGETDTYENPFEKYKAEIAAADTKIKLNDDVL